MTIKDFFRGIPKYKLLFLVIFMILAGFDGVVMSQVISSVTLFNSKSTIQDFVYLLVYGIVSYLFIQLSSMIVSIINNNIIEEYKKKFLETINDDLNIPLAMSIIWEIIKSEKKSKQYAELLLDFDRVLGLDLKNSKKYLESKEKIQIPEDIKELIEERKKAREEKNWQLSDLLRDQIKEKGYIVKDTKEGMTIDKI